MKRLSLKKTAAAAAAAIMAFSMLPVSASADGGRNTNPHAYQYYSSLTGYYYDSYSSALAASNNNPAYVYDTYNGSYYYNGYNYNGYYRNGYYYNGYYYNGNIYDGYYNGGYYYSSAYPYYSTVTGRYYSTLADAVTASNGNSSAVVYRSGIDTITGYSDKYPYYSSVTGKCYSSYATALAASNNNTSYVYYIGSGTTSYTVANPYYYYDYYYYTYPYYYSSYYYPSSYTYKYTYVTSDQSTTNAADGVPYYYGNKKVWGWTVLSNRISRAAKGSVIAINMNKSNIVPAEVFKAAKGKDMTIQFVVDNGATWTINTDKITDVKEVNINVEYGTSYVPKELVRQAAQGSIATAEITVGDHYGSLGFTGELTVKFSKKRANAFVKAYVYDESTNSLKLVDKTMINSNGYATFTTKQSGPYILVLS